MTTAPLTAAQSSPLTIANTTTTTINSKPLVDSLTNTVPETVQFSGRDGNSSNSETNKSNSNRTPTKFPALSEVPHRRSASVSTAHSVTSKSKQNSTPPVDMATASGSASQGSHGENTGRWTAEEHRLFLQGLEQHGKGWKKIASLIKSRTVVQIRTHAQKYFQKLAKARQNGEEGDVAMEGRGGVASITSVSTTAVLPKRRRQTTGTKRKAIQSVVASAQRQGKKLAAAKTNPTRHHPLPPPLPTVAPALAHYTLPSTAMMAKNGTAVKEEFVSPTNLSGPALEDSLFRFLTPVPVSEPPLNEVARQAGANPISLPTDNPSSIPTVGAGEISPTGVSDLMLYPSWTDSKEPPSWYSKGADIDALLDMGDSLDWLDDTGDLNESYVPPVVDTAMAAPEPHTTFHRYSDLGHSKGLHSTSVTSLPHVDSNANVESVVPPLPSIFDGAPDSGEHLETTEGMVPSNSTSHLADEIDDSEGIHEHLQVFDSPLEENDFVSAILEEDTIDVTAALAAS